MSLDIDKLFSGMQNAPMFGRGNYMGEGLFQVKITNVFVKPRFKGGNVFICEFQILESNNEKHKVGTTGSWCPKIELPNTFGDIKSLMFAATGTDPKTVKAEDGALHGQASLLARAACGSESAKAELKQTFAQQGIDHDGSIIGCEVRLECTQTKTKENKDFTRYTWSPADC
jgi:hypothetical protein